MGFGTVSVSGVRYLFRVDQTRNIGRDRPDEKLRVREAAIVSVVPISDAKLLNSFKSQSWLSRLGPKIGVGKKCRLGWKIVVNLYYAHPSIHARRSGVETSSPIHPIQLVAEVAAKRRKNSLNRKLF